MYENDLAIIFNDIYVRRCVKDMKKRYNASVCRKKNITRLTCILIYLIIFTHLNVNTKIVLEYFKIVSNTFVCICTNSVSRSGRRPEKTKIEKCHARPQIKLD